MSPIPGVNQAYAMVISDECQRFASNSNSMGMNSISMSGVDPLAMYSRSGGSTNAQVPNKFKKNFGIVCEFCRCKVHTKDQCYKLIGYPPEYKSKRKAVNGAGNTAYMVNKGTANTGNAVQAHGVQAHEVQTSAVGKALLVSENNDVWIIDTGATNHMISKIGMLNKESVVEVKCPKPVSLPNGEVAYVTHTGSCHISPTIIVTDELYTGKVKVIGKKSDGLYLLQKNVAQDQITHQSCMMTEREEREKQLSKEEVCVWHKRLGHVSSHILNKLFPVNSDCMNRVLKKCSVCPYAKQTRSVFPVSSIKSTEFFELIHLDVWGPYKKATFDDWIPRVDSVTRDITLDQNCSQEMQSSEESEQEMVEETTVMEHVEEIHNSENQGNLEEVVPRRSTRGQFVAATSINTEPATYAEASKEPKWVEAMQAEIKALQDNNTWELVDLPKGKSPIG
ncbi:hypothetical protein KY290_010315 [Solanum tuberosum]|uniref:GAG-pre-integrase domain-containing protein n=1 Tax=Solanum tuberosum TaxID=4113 RepID=A0ABQ7VXF6_SOLTU|nr:hypothetical protein KY290_010315 [Solanum tuberosum]